MKIILKPNQNSRRTDKHGLTRWDTVDLCSSDGAVYGSVHVDLFWEGSVRAAFYDDMYIHGKTIVLKCEESHETD